MHSHTTPTRSHRPKASWVTSGVTIGEKVSILAQSGVSKNLEQNKVYFGTPAEESREKLKQIAYLKRLTK